MSKDELMTVPLKKGAYDKPERVNPNIPSRKYDNIDSACEQSRIGNDGNIYLPEDQMANLLNKNKKTARYVLDNNIPDSDRITINNQKMVNSAPIVGYLDRFSHQTRDAEDAVLSRYGRDSLTRIGDSDQAEAQRRMIDTHVSKELPKLRNERNVNYDEITGEPLEKGAAFHHKNNKSIHNNPLDVLDSNQGLVVNPDTHREIHKRNIMDENELERNREDIKNTVKCKQTR